jgi:carbon monoxide dehydrogenase subunit G
MKPRAAPAPSSRFVVDYRDVVVLSARPDEVWAALDDLGQVAEWSKWVERIQMDADHLQEGAVVEVWISTPLPFTVKVRLRLDSCIPGRLLVARVDGDLAGEARLSLTSDGSATLGEVSWSLEMKHGFMKALAIVSGPLLRWGHDLVAEATISSFSQWLSGRATERGDLGSSE